MNDEVIRTLAARVSLGLAGADEVCRVADAQLTSGHYTQNASELSHLSDPTWADVRPLFEAWMRELGVAVPEKEQAIWTALRHHMARLAQATVDSDAQHEVCEIANVYFNTEMAGSSTRFAGDSHDIQRLYGIYWELSDLPDTFRLSPTSIPSAKRDLLQEARQEATRWISEHAA